MASLAHLISFSRLVTLVQDRGPDADIIDAWESCGVDDLIVSVKPARDEYARASGFASEWNLFLQSSEFLRGTEAWPAIIRDRARSAYASAIVTAVYGMSRKGPASQVAFELAAAEDTKDAVTFEPKVTWFDNSMRESLKR